MLDDLPLDTVSGGCIPQTDDDASFEEVNDDFSVEDNEGQEDD